MAPLQKTVTLIDDYGAMVDVEVVIDSTTAFGLFPSSLLASLGVEPFRDLERRSAQRMGMVEAMLQGEAGYIMCVFGDEDRVPRLGFHNLASLRLQLNEQGDDLEPLVIEYHEHPKLGSNV